MVFLYVEGAEVSLNPRRSTPEEHFKGGRVILAPSLRVQSTRQGSREARQLFLASVLSSEGWMLVPASDSHFYSAQEGIQAQETG